MSKVEHNIKSVIRQAGYKITSNHLKDLVKEYNDYKQPIGTCLMEIVAEPTEFLDFLKQKDL